MVTDLRIKVVLTIMTQLLTVNSQGGFKCVLPLELGLSTDCFCRSVLITYLHQVALTQTE